MALLACVWLLWPDPGHRAADQQSRGRTGQQSPAHAGLGDGLVGAAQASVAVSAKQQLAGDAAAVQYRLKQRLRQVARTMPSIGIPQEVPGQPRPEGAAVAGNPRTALAGADPRADPAEPNILPDPTAIARAVPGAGPARAEAPPDAEAANAAAASDPGPGATVAGSAGAAVEPPSEADPASPEAAPDPATILPAAAPEPREPPERQPERRTVALLEVPADIVAREPDQRRTPTWLRNAVATVPDSRPAIAVVIDDLGLNRRGTAALNRLRAPLTLAFLPYATDLDAQTRAARAAGHELMVHVPMEPRSQQEWPGPNALTAQLGPAELISRLRSQLRSFRGFVGVNNHMGSLLTADPERMAIVMAELRQRDLLFLDSRTTPDSVAARTAARMHVPFAERDVFIDNDLDLQSVLRALAHAEQIARHQGHAVAMGHPHDVTIEALRRWLPGLDDRGVALVPISAIVARQSCASGLILVGDACTRYAVAESAVR